MDKKLTQRRRFLDNDIPYDDIDVEMIDLIDILNFKLDYRTQYCCYGHLELGDYNEQSYIVFDNCVSDEMIYELMDHQFLRNKKYGEFNKWARHVGDNLRVNWVWTATVCSINFKKGRRLFLNRFYRNMKNFRVSV